MGQTNHPSSDPLADPRGLGTGAGTGSSDQAQGDAPAADEFFPRSQVSPEVEARWKEMQAAYTRKTQAIAEERKAAQAELYKAQLLDQLVDNPRFQKLLKQLQEEEPGEPSYEEGGWEEAPVDEPPALKRVSEQVRNLERKTDQLQQQRLIEEFKRANPDWEQHKEGMAAAWRENPQRTVQDAYDRALALEYKRLTAQRQQQQRLAGASVEAPTNQRSAVTPPKPVNSMQEAAARAAEALGITMND